MGCAVRITWDGGVGTGAAIAERLVLTCEHVVRGRVEVEVALASGGPTRFRVVESDAELDVALLEPCDPAMSVPVELRATPRELGRGRRPVAGETIVELCTDEPGTKRSMPIELRPAAPGATRIPFGVPDRREGIRRGYSGGPVLDLGASAGTQLLLGIVRARDEHSVDALDAGGAGWFVPIESIAARFEVVANLVQSPIERDPVWEQHWEPRSRGVASSEDHGFFFSGREQAYAKLAAHLEGGTGLLIVSGSRGRGKSAVLARAVALGSPRYVQQLRKSGEDALDRSRPLRRPLDAATTAYAKTATSLAGEIAEQLGFGPCDCDELVVRVKRTGLVPALVIDGVDEAVDPGALMRELILPLVRARARIAIGALGARLHGADLPTDTTWVDLDTQPFGDDAIPAYFQRRLLATRRYEQSEASQVAEVAAERAAGNFLVAELIARTLASSEPIDTGAQDWQSSIATGVGSAFYNYLARFGQERDRVLALLHPLALALGDGLSIEPGSAWLAAANRLRPDDLDPVDAADLRRLSRRAADYLIVSSPDGQRRLYHEGLSEAVRTLSAEQALTRTAAAATPEALRGELERAEVAFVQVLAEQLPRDLDSPASDYAALDPYLLHHLPTHLAEHGMAQDLLDRPGLLLSADAESLRAALVNDALTVPASKQGEALAALHALAHPASSLPQRVAALRAALLRQDEQQLADRVLRELRSPADLPYTLVSGPALPSFHLTIPAAHAGGCIAIALTRYRGEPLIVSAGLDQAVRSWLLDGRPGPYCQEQFPGLPISLLVTEHEGEPLLIGCAAGHNIVSWRLDGRQGPLDVRDAPPWAARQARTIEHEQGTLVVVPGHDRRLYSWWLDGTPGPIDFEMPDDHFASLASIVCEDAPLLVAGGEDGNLCSWRLNGAPGPLQIAHAHNSSVLSLTLATLKDGRPLLVSASPRELRSWWLDGRPGPLHVDGIEPPRQLAVAIHKRGPLVIGAGMLGSLQSWRLGGRPGPLAEDAAHGSQIFALAIVEQPSTAPLILTGSMDGSIRSWQVDDKPASTAPKVPRRREISGLAAIEHEQRPLLALASIDGSLQSMWLDGTPGPSLGNARARQNLRELLATEIDGRQLIVACGKEQEGRGDPLGQAVLRSWWLGGEPGPLQYDTPGLLNHLLTTEHEGQPLIVAAYTHELHQGSDRKQHLRSWWIDGRPGPLSKRLADIEQLAGLALATHGGETVIVAAGSDGALRAFTLAGERVTSSKVDTEGARLHSMAVATTDGGEPLIVTGDGWGRLRSTWLDGGPGPLADSLARANAMNTLVAIECEGSPLIVAAGNGGLTSWRLDGQPGPLAYRTARIEHLVIAEERGVAMALVSSDADQVLLAHAIPAAQ